jgi:hypothetical protein
MNKRSYASAWWFALRFIVIFGLLIAPWPGLNQAYSRYFQSFGQWSFDATGDSGRKVIFAPASGEVPELDTRVTLENTALASSSGQVEGRRTGLNTRSIGWVPTALTIALVLATPIPWGRRLGALAAGLVLIHLFIYVSLLSWVWNESTELSLLSLSNFWKQALDELNYELMNQLGISFSVPVVIWVIVAFRRTDAINA